MFRSEVLNSNSISEIKVPNKSLSHELNNVLFADVVVAQTNRCKTLLLKHEILKKLVTYIKP